MEKKYSNLIVRSLQYEPDMSPEFKRIYEAFARRVLWIDGDVVPGAFQMNTSWYQAVPEKDPIFETHAHPSSEIIGFFGSDPAHPYELGGEIHITIDGETHVIDSSSYIFIPPDVPHALSIKRVDRPIFHFSVVNEGNYNNSAYE